MSYYKIIVINLHGAYHSNPHPSTIIKPPVLGSPHHTPPPPATVTKGSPHHTPSPSATVTKGILKSPGNTL